MNNQKEIKPLDIPAIGKQMSDQMDAWMYASLGITIQEHICSFCKVREYKHINSVGDNVMDHPFFNNNLEYLEWKAQ